MGVAVFPIQNRHKVRLLQEVQLCGRGAGGLPEGAGGLREGAGSAGRVQGGCRGCRGAAGGAEGAAVENNFESSKSSSFVASITMIKEEKGVVELYSLLDHKSQ